MASIVHLLRSLWLELVVSFLPIFGAMTAAMAAGTAWVVGRKKIQPISTEAHYGRHLTPKRDLTFSALAGLGVAALEIAGYGFLAAKVEAFTGSDDSTWTLFSLRGVGFSPPIWVTNGRFFPLAHLEYNLVGRYTHTAAGYHALPVAMLAVLLCILFVIDCEQSFAERAWLVALFPIAPSIVISFSGLVYSETNVVVCLACLVLFVARFEQSGAMGWAVAASVMAQAMVYYKETAFLLLLGFACGRLLLRVRGGQESGWDVKRLGSRESRLDMCFIAISLLFLAYYGAVMGRHMNMQYAKAIAVPWADAFRYFLTIDFLGVIFVAATSARIWLIAIRKVNPSPLWDGLACGGVACYISYLALRMCGRHYLAPVDLIAMLYLGRLAFLGWGKLRTGRKRLIVALTVAVAVQFVVISASLVYQRENIIHAKARMADVVISEVHDHGGRPVRLYFPFADGYSIAEFSAYLSYLGLKVEGGDGDGQPNVILLSGTLASDGRCLDYESFLCHASVRPMMGDLVVELPDDRASQAAEESYREGGICFFSYEPEPRLSRSKVIVPLLLVGAQQERAVQFSDRWMIASISQWR